MPDTTRTFVALPIPSDLAAKLGRLQSLVAPDAPGARWVVPEEMHITLVFLGDIPHTDLADLCRSVVDASSPVAPFELRIQGLGTFPDPERPRVIWAGIEGSGLDRLHALQKAITAAVVDAGYPPADDRFHPHVTLARLKPRRDSTPDLRPAERQHAGWIAGHFRASEVVVYSSQFDAEGPTYHPLARITLKGRKIESSP